MSTCLSSRACGFDLEHMIKWPYSTNDSSRTTSNSSSPSSTLSESTNSPIAISTRKARKPRKRPNQTYNEAAALLSLACPNIFNTKHLIKKPTNLPKFIKHPPHFFNEQPELIETSEYSLGHQIAEKPCSLTESKIATLCQNTGEIELNCVCVELGDECLDDFDTESILDEEIEQGIDSIMGESNSVIDNKESNDIITYGYPIGLGFGVRNGVRALKNCDDRNWWCFPMVDVSPAINGKFEKSPIGKKKKKKVEELMKSELGFNSWGLDNLSKRIESEKRLVLKLDYDDVLNDWSDNGSPVPEEIWHKAPMGGDIYARAANIDLFSEKGGRRESSATRFIDKNQSKKIWHPVKNISSDRRSRCKGRFVKKSISTACDGET